MKWRTARFCTCGDVELIALTDFARNEQTVGSIPTGGSQVQVRPRPLWTVPVREGE